MGGGKRGMKVERGALEECEEEDGGGGRLALNSSISAYVRVSVYA